MIPAFVTSFGRTTMLERCVASLRRFSLEITVVGHLGHLGKKTSAHGCFQVP